MTERRKKTEESGRYVVIGLGGVGNLLVRLLVPYLHSLEERSLVVAVDGDRFEERNRARMLFGRSGPKPVVIAEELSDVYGDRTTIITVPHYVSEENVSGYIGEGDVVFCAPDNHATRRLVEQRCQELPEVALFSGGNDGVEGDTTGTYGNVQVYLRSGGRDLTNPLSRFHPEIADPSDRTPDAAGCEAATSAAPQLLFTNAAVASAMLAVFYAWRSEKLDYEEVYLDIVTGKHEPVRRTVSAPSSRSAGAAAPLTPSASPVSS
jgi:molybdopterin/thiamine biosynthesis adenylyltransferase